MQEEQGITLVEIPDEGAIPEFYSNILRVNTNLYGISILFGRGRPTGITGDAVRTDAVCAVHMSPSHAKSLFLLLGQQLRTYEEKWGMIPVPPELEKE